MKRKKVEYFSKNSRSVEMENYYYFSKYLFMYLTDTEFPVSAWQ